MVDDPRLCSFCGLPAPPTWGRRDPAEPAYCCYGCRLASQMQTGNGGIDPALLARLGIAVFFAMNVMAFTMALWTHDVYGQSSVSSFEASLLGIFRWLTFLFSLPVYYLLGIPLAQNCWTQLRLGAGAADLLLLIGVAAAFIASLPAIVLDSGHVYFEVGVLVLVFVTVGRVLEARCKQQAMHALDALDRLLPETIHYKESGAIRSKPLDDAEPGDIVIVRASERVPCDGIIQGSPATIDEQIWTGESTPRIKDAGTSVLAGSVNVAGDLRIQVTARPRDGAIARLALLVRQARMTRGSFECLAERMSRMLLPCVLFIAIASSVLHGARSGFEAGLLAGLAVVLIACPCALGIATPLAVWAALGAAAKRGIVFQSGDVLERLAGVRAVLFDKTGTLTEGSSRVVAVAIDETTSVDLVDAIAESMTAASHHPCSRAIAAHIKHAIPAPSPSGTPGGEGRGEGGQYPTRNLEIIAGSTPSPASPLPRSTGGEGGQISITTQAGRGLETLWPFDNGPALVRLGSPTFIIDAAPSVKLSAFANDAFTRGDTIVGVAWHNRIRAWFRIAEALRPEATRAVKRLRDDGLTVRILTGDRRSRAERLARELAIPVDAELMPDDKWRILREARDQFGSVAMVGDGVNDGPALAGADVGFALGCGTDLARASAGVCLLGNNLTQIADAIELSRRAVRTIKTNLFWAFAYNIVGVGVAAAGLLNPVIAAAVMVASSLFVIANSSRLTRDEAANQPATKPLVQPEAA